MPPTAVYCYRCDWKGRRRPGDCACYDEWAMTCSCVWGRCPKCDTAVSTTSPAQRLRDGMRVQRWLESPDGQACMADIDRRFRKPAALATES